jgi:tRNA C32,U32 (ribose-2'-O)-methylase TrmJ
VLRHHGACADDNDAAINGLPELLRRPEIQAALSPLEALEGSQAPCVALVFGREFEGLSEDEIQQCNVCCSITMGRLQESLSLSHAVCVVLGHLFEQRLTLMPAEFRKTFQSSIFAAKNPAFE